MIAKHASLCQVVFTLCRIVKQSVTNYVSDRASVHIGNANSGTIFAPKQLCSAPLLKVERPVSDRFLKRPGPSLNTFVQAEIVTEPLIGKFEAITAGSRCDPERNGTT